MQRTAGALEARGGQHQQRQGMQQCRRLAPVARPSVRCSAAAAPRAHRGAQKSACGERARHRREPSSVVPSAAAAFVLAPPAPAAAASTTPRERAKEHSAQWQSEIERLAASTPNPPTRVTATGRVVAIGDLHGDWHKAIEAFRAAGVITVTDDEVLWCGGDTVVVQLGDVMDRGDYEIAIVNLLRGLDQQAREHGGAVYMLNGNHESLNVCGDFRYVTPGAFVESALFAGVDEEELGDWELLARVRFAVYKPGGPMAVELSKNPTVLVVNDTVFAHGGVLPIHVAYGLDKLNNDVAAWMRGDRDSEGRKAQPPLLAMGDATSVMWNRSLSRERFPSQTERYQASVQLKQVLERVGAKRLVVGHTPQLGGANSECDGCVWRVDVGMSSGVLDRPVQVLEIGKAASTGVSEVRVLPLPTGFAPRRSLADQGLAMSRL